MRSNQGDFWFCEYSYSEYLCCDSAFAHKKEFYIFKLGHRVIYLTWGTFYLPTLSRFFFLARHVTFWQWTLAALHVTIVILIFFVPPQVVILLACVTMGYSNIVSHHIFCFNLCMSPLLSINILTVTFNVFLFCCVTLLIRSFCLILTVFLAISHPFTC
jgi:hypothetical protein